MDQPTPFDHAEAVFTAYERRFAEWLDAHPISPIACRPERIEIMRLALSDAVQGAPDSGWVRRKDVIDLLTRLAGEAAEMALDGDPQQARVREGQEAAYTRTKYAIAFMDAITGHETRVSAFVDRAWRDLLDKDDRTSPSEYPEMMALITHDELAEIIFAAAGSQ